MYVSKGGRGVGQADLSSWGYISPCGNPPGSDSSSDSSSSSGSNPNQQQLMTWGFVAVAGLLLFGVFDG